MSPKNPGGFNPAQQPRLTPDQYGQILGQYVNIGSQFKKWFDDTGLKWWIIAAGVGATFETMHVLWLAIRFLKIVP